MFTGKTLAKSTHCVTRLESLVASTNKLNSELREKLESVRHELVNEKSKNISIESQLKSSIDRENQKDELHRHEIEGLEREWNKKVDSFTSIISMYNELRLRSEALENEVSKVEMLESIII